MSSVEDLVQWLHAQLDEDERIAEATTEHQPYDEWDAVGAGGEDDAARSWWEVAKIARMERSPAARSLAMHIAAHDPARVLREIDAKRQLLALHNAVWIDTGDADGNDRSGYFCGECDAQTFPCRTLRLLALPYADREGYLESWRP